MDKLARDRLAKIAPTTQSNSAGWPVDYEDGNKKYINADTGKVYDFRSEDERIFIFDDIPRRMLCKGGEGAGKSVLGIRKLLRKLGLGMSGIMASPNLPHFKKSLWREFRLWCPPDALIPQQRHYLDKSWQPREPFELVFTNYTTIMCGGLDNPRSWEGPNVHFAYIDEARHLPDATALTVLDGRIRLSGPKGEPPQLWLTTTPKKHWLYEYFGPEQPGDKFAEFKRESLVITIPVEANRANLADGYIESRRNSLTEVEARVLMDAEWEDESDIEKFVNIIWWDNCREPLPPLTRSEPLVIALDAAKGGETNVADCFAMVAVSRHPERRQDAAVRYCGIWQPQPGQLLNFEPIEQELVRLCREFSVIEVCYDPYQLHDMCTRLKARGVANFQEFNQASPRLIADKQLQDLIMSRRIAHDGNPLLRQHVDNADIKKADKEGIRIVKRANSLKVDGAVALSMASKEILRFNLT